MEPFDRFEQHLRDALAHLYDPAYLPPDGLWAVTGCDPQQGVEAVQAALIRAIEDLKPAPNVPPTARSKRIYELLSYRYVHDLTQEQAAERLGITPRHLRREQREAVHVLARRLWEQSRAEAPLVDDFAQAEGTPRKGTTPPGILSPAWRSQVRQELASLQKSAPGAVTDVGATIRGVIELGSTLTARHDIYLGMEPVEPDLSAAIHPSALRQVLLAAIGDLVQHMSSGQITLRAEGGAERVQVTIMGSPAKVDGTPTSSLIREILAPQGGSVEVDADGDSVTVQVKLPPVEEIVVLVVDDNMDLVHFYRRYVAGTRYRIVHTAKGKRVFEAIEASAPDIIVLDIMLPDVDGWELLAHLHEHPATKPIPLVVCSVVREEELALALGAALYLPKPVRRRQFIRALDRALGQAPITATTSRANNAATG